MMPKLLIRNLAQLLVVLWLLIGCLTGTFITLFNYDRSAFADPAVWLSMALALFLPAAVACLLIVTPVKSGRFLLPEKLDGAAAYLCATLRGCFLIKLVNIFMPLAMTLRLEVTDRGDHSLWLALATLLTEFIFWVLFLWLAPWLSMAVVGQIDSGVMWYTRVWLSVKGLLNPD